MTAGWRLMAELEAGAVQVHASCVAHGGHAVLLLGPPGSGKSDLALRLIGRDWVLVADDRVDIVDGRASPPEALAGLLELRGLGILRLPHRPRVRLALALDLGARPDRLPAPADINPAYGVPLLAFDPWEASAPEKAHAALAASLHTLPVIAGAFAGPDAGRGA